MAISEATRDYAILGGEKTYLDEPSDEEPDKADFEKRLRRIERLREALFCLEAADETVHAS